MRTIIAGAAAHASRPFGRLLSALHRSPAPRGGSHRSDLALAPATGRERRRAPRAVHEMDFAYYAALTQRHG